MSRIEYINQIDEKTGFIYQIPWVSPDTTLRKIEEEPPLCYKFLEIQEILNKKEEVKYD